MRQVATASKTETVFHSSNVDTTHLDDMDKELVSMWKTYKLQRKYENSVALGEFFAEFTAKFGYFYIIVNRYKLVIDKEVAKQTAEIHEAMEGQPVSKLDGTVRRAERALRAKSDYYISQVSWAKLCINSMQTMLRLYGDESKMGLR